MKYSSVSHFKMNLFSKKNKKIIKKKKKKDVF